MAVIVVDPSTLPKVSSGTFSSLDPYQQRRLNAVSEKLRAEDGRERYLKLMAIDPYMAKDSGGTPYWGSYRHIMETMLTMMEREMDKCQGY